MLKRKVGHNDEEPVFSAKRRLKQDTCQGTISDSSKRKLRREEYTVGWICPLEVEQTAALEMLDEEHERLPQPPTDHNVFTLSSIGGHNVVIAGLHTPGNNPAATDGRFCFVW
jgi:hypothetical protein